MLKHSPSRNQKPKAVKLNLAFRMFLMVAIGVWMIYQLRLFFSHRLASENGGLVKHEAGSQQMKLGLGRRGLVKPDDDKEGRGADTKEEVKTEDMNATEQDVEDEEEIEQTEYLVEGIEKVGDDEDEGLELDDPLEENDLQSDAGHNENRIERKIEDDDNDLSKRPRNNAMDRS